MSSLLHAVYRSHQGIIRGTLRQGSVRWSLHSFSRQHLVVTQRNEVQLHRNKAEEHVAHEIILNMQFYHATYHTMHDAPINMSEASR